MTLPRTAKVPFGGDDNPEQWPEDVWKQDYQLFDLARIDTVTLGVVDWALTQPAPDVYDFTVLDRIVARAATEGTRLRFLLNHAARPVEVTARTAGVDLLTGDRISGGGAVRLPADGVVVLKEER